MQHPGHVQYDAVLEAFIADLDYEIALALRPLRQLARHRPYNPSDRAQAEEFMAAAESLLVRSGVRARIEAMRARQVEFEPLIRSIRTRSAQHRQASGAAVYDRLIAQQDVNRCVMCDRELTLTLHSSAELVVPGRADQVAWARSTALRNLRQYHRHGRFSSSACPAAIDPWSPRYARWLETFSPGNIVRIRAEAADLAVQNRQSRFGSSSTAHLRGTI